MLDKDEIRRTMRERRKALTPEARRAASEIVCAKLAADSDIGLRVDPFEGWSPIAVYLASPQEIDLSPFIRKMLAMGVKVGREDEESLYCVKESATDETVYYFEIEWMPAPVPYASDIRHYLALRYQKEFQK